MTDIWSILFNVPCLMPVLVCQYCLLYSIFSRRNSIVDDNSLYNLLCILYYSRIKQKKTHAHEIVSIRFGGLNWENKNKIKLNCSQKPKHTKLCNNVANIITWILFIKLMTVQKRSEKDTQHQKKKKRQQQQHQQ